MKADAITTCYVGPQISPEQFIQEHIFLHLNKGLIQGYDGEKHYTLHPGESCIVRKNRLARYSKQKVGEFFSKVVFIFDEAFLGTFKRKYCIEPVPFVRNQAFIQIKKDPVIKNLLSSLAPFYTEDGKVDAAFADLKREQLLLILLRLQPELSGVFFDFSKPGRLDLEAFMQQHYKFNVPMTRFAFLTGRSLSSFKRDFRELFNETPGRWLLKRRLQEAHFLTEHTKLKPADFYLELGFEDLTHFYFAFKKQFGYSPRDLNRD